MVGTKIWIYSYQNLATNEYPNIFVSKKLTRMNIRIYSYPKSWHKRISEYIRIQKMIRTNIRINIRIKNIRIFEYSNIFVTLWNTTFQLKCNAAIFLATFPLPPKSFFLLLSTLRTGIGASGEILSTNPARRTPPTTTNTNYTNTNYTDCLSLALIFSGERVAT